jgi:hypothetical protein
VRSPKPSMRRCPTAKVAPTWARWLSRRPSGHLPRWWGGRLGGLFGTNTEDLRRVLSGLATKTQFAGLAQDFFARFVNKTLSYFLSKTLPAHIGKGERFPTVATHGEFLKGLSTHCREAARIVEDFAGAWLAKKNWETKGDISRREAKAFIDYAMVKLVDELKRGAAAHG